MIPTPDGVRYLHLGAGERVPKPYHLRWLVPWLCGRRDRAWLVSAWSSWVAAAVLVGLLAPSWQTGVAAGLMFAALPGIRFNVRHPILVDLPAMALAIGAAVLASQGQLVAAVVVAVLAGTAKESSPLFAAVYAWCPWLLLGLVAPAVRWLVSRPAAIADDPLRRYQIGPGGYVPEFAWILEHPFRAGVKYHRAAWWDGAVMVAPWGAALVALADPSWQLLVALVAGYAQLLVATDTVRLYQWAAPVVCVAAATAVPAGWLVVLVVLCVWNPLAGDGV